MNINILVMCGIWLYLNLLKRSKYSNETLFNNFMKIKNRGPDNSIFNIYNNLILILKIII